MGPNKQVHAAYQKNDHTGVTILLYGHFSCCRPKNVSSNQFVFCIPNLNCLLVEPFVLVDDTRLELVTLNRACSTLYREEPLEVPFIPPFIAPRWLQALHPPQAPQEAQLPPQELLPAFLSRIMPRSSRPTISTRTATSTILIQLAESQISSSITSLTRGDAVREEG